MVHVNWNAIRQLCLSDLWIRFCGNITIIHALIIASNENSIRTLQKWKLILNDKPHSLEDGFTTVCMVIYV